MRTEELKKGLLSQRFNLQRGSLQISLVSLLLSLLLALLRLPPLRLLLLLPWLAVFLKPTQILLTRPALR
jgi:cellulose synthase/poly-beta-1,6-N-acetylglucosamine synthase-like glycosyltransferase